MLSWEHIYSLGLLLTLQQINVCIFSQEQIVNQMSNQNLYALFMQFNDVLQNNTTTILNKWRIIKMIEFLSFNRHKLAIVSFSAILDILI